MDWGELPLEGGCQRGAVRYRITREPDAVFVCHCRECWAQSASAFGISVYIGHADFEVTGDTARWTRVAGSGSTTNCHFCTRCGSRFWYDGPPGDPIVSVKAGSLDRPPDLSQAVHIWTRSKLPEVVIPEGAERHPFEPE